LDTNPKENMANYELMLIINPTISEEDRNASIENLKSLFEKNEAKIEKEDIWGDKKLAYKINKLDRGFYALYDLDLDGKLIKEISKQINLDKNIIRYMFTKKEA
jgi:small subunit ribosomal protein S6